MWPYTTAHTGAGLRVLSFRSAGHTISFICLPAPGRVEIDTRHRAEGKAEEAESIERWEWAGGDGRMDASKEKLESR